MSILIKGEKMPETCEDCPCFYDYIECMALHKAFESDMHFDCTEERRYEGCPLVEVPEPHGRLIDAEPLEHRSPKLKALILQQPTVIEGEGQEHEKEIL